MVGKVIGALIGDEIAKKHGESGAKGALVGAVATALVKRLSLPALAAVGGFAAWRKYRSGKKAAAA